MSDVRFEALRRRASLFPDRYPRGFTRDARELHDRCIIFDLHVDPLLQNCFFGYDLAQRHELDWHPLRNGLPYWLLRDVAGRGRNNPSFNHVDLPRMREAGYTGAGFGIHWWPDWGQDGRLSAWRGIGRQIAALQKLIDRGELRAAGSPADVCCAFAAGVLCGFPGVEGLHCLGKIRPDTRAERLDRIDQLFHRGARYITLCHQKGNDVAVPSWSMLDKHSPPDPQTPLGDFAPAVISRMNQAGMLIDLAHTNTRGILQACELSKRPVIATHAGAQMASPPHRPDHGRDLPRLLEDSAIKAIANTGGAVGVLFSPEFLTGTETAGLECVVNHIRYIVDLVGEDHTCFGTDFDGWITPPLDISDCTDLPLLTQKLLDAGLSEVAIRKMYGLNFLRVWAEVLRSR
jgi:membrane dipeptidase